MIFRPTQEPGTQTSLQPGDVIEITPAGAVVILRGPVPLIFTEDHRSTGTYFNLKVAQGQTMDHEYAWWMARALAGIAGLHVVDSYELSKQGYHAFPVTDVAPAE